MVQFSRYLSSRRWERRTLLRVVLPLILLSFFGTLIFAACFFPEPYDWRYRVISNLLSPRDDPHYYRVPSIGVALAGLLMLPLAGYFADRLRPISSPLARVVHWSFFAGTLALISAAIMVPQHIHPVFGLRRLHEALARSSAMLIGISMLVACACAVLDRRRLALLDRRLLPAWLCLTVLPVAGILASELLLYLSRLWSGWGPAIRVAMRHSVFWHLGFWEWAGAAAVFLFLLTATWLLPEK